MHVPLHWARAEHRFDPEGRHKVVAWRWSDRSLEEARAAARARLAELVAAIEAGRRPEQPDYADRPVREERLSIHPEGAAEPFAIVTRNASGAEVLNAARVPFVDLDFAHQPGPGLVAWLRRLFLGKPVPSPEERAVARVRRWFEAHTEARGRLYRTRSGLRLLLLHTVLEPGGAEAQGLLATLGADPLYRRLCRIQGSFRARLTPKPHRVAVKRIPHDWPPEGEAEAAARARWIEEYAARCQGYDTCRLVEELGRGSALPEADRVRELHDRASISFAGRPLA